MHLIVAVVVVFLLLMVNEMWWRKHKSHGELSRKFVHIAVGCFVAFWPFFLSWGQIELLSVAFLIVVGLSKYLRIFSAIHSVQRPTQGELFFALAVGIVAVVTHDEWIYAVALLQMALGDGLAAVIGVRYGRHSRYKVFDATKSVIGTFTFFAVAIVLLLGYQHFSGATITLPYLLVLATSSSFIENIGVYGLDNLLVPLLIAYPLSR